jgi:mono/diheme cytochrome c family protein
LCLVSAPLAAAGPEVFLRGDPNSSGDVDLSDAIYILRYLFFGGPAALCDGQSNTNSSRGTDLSDAIFVLRFLFNGGPEPGPLSETEVADCEARRTVRCGEEVFQRPDARGNAFSCAHCHDSGPAAPPPAEGVLLVAHGLGDAARRPSYFNGALGDLPAAINECRRDWMAAPDYEPGDPELTQLAAYLASLAGSGGPVAPLSFHVDSPSTSGPSSGDPERGCELFGRACSGCHGGSGDGVSGLGPSVWSRPFTADELREVVRLSGPTPATAPGTVFSGLIGNRMPFWSQERLGDADVEDLVAYLVVAQDASRRDCDRVVPPQLLRAANFQTFQHGVRGRVEHWSDRTIRLRNFNYDGLGPNDVLVWLYFKEDDIQAILRGYPISGHLGRPLPYIDEFLEFEIPEEITRDRFNTVSIWCTLFQLNYGEAFVGQ